MRVRPGFLAMGLSGLVAPCQPQAGRAQEQPVKIGVLTDLSGFAADSGGAGVVTAVRMAVKDAGGEALGRKVELVQADTLNKPDSAAQTARRWFETEGVDAIV